MNALRDRRLIVNRWQSLIEHHCMVKSSKGLYIKATQLSSCLNKYKNVRIERYALYNDFAKKLFEQSPHKLI